MAYPNAHLPQIASPRGQVLCFLYIEKIRLTLDRHRQERQDVTFHIKSGKTKIGEMQDAKCRTERSLYSEGGQVGCWLSYRV